MARQKGRTIQAQLHTLFSDGVTAGLTDGQLLERFTTRRGEAAELAFAALIERHGPMVLGACRKILRDDHEAEDAFQASFLVLVFKGGSLWVEDSLGPWLHRVACRIAVRARLAAGRREEAGRRMAEYAGDRSGGEGRDALGRALHEEIDRLPGVFREPIVLCDLEGRTYEEVARHLGCPVGTVKSRLARGRKRLRVELTRRGLAPSDGLLVAGLSPNPPKAAVPAMLSDSVVHAAMRVAAGTMAAGTVPAPVAELIEGMLRMMFLARVTRCVGAVLAVGVLTVGMGVLIHRSAGAPPQDLPALEAAKPKASPPVPEGDDPAKKGEKRAGEIIARVRNIARNAPDDRPISMVAIDPETAAWRTIATNLPPGPVSPDGRYIVYSQLGPDHDASALGIWVYDTTGEAPPRRVFELNGVPHWSHDGRRIVIGVSLAGPKFETWSVDADGTNRTRLPIPETDLVLDCSRDGTWLATRTIGGEPDRRGRLVLVHPDGTGARQLTAGSAKEDVFTIFEISPDGRSIAYAEVRTENKIRRCKLFVMDIEGTNRREIPVTFDPGLTVKPSWSSDGSRLALNAMDGRTKEGSIALVDLDGTNFRKIPLPPGTWNLHVCDWTTLAPGLRVHDLEELMREDAKSPRGRYRALIEEIKKTKPFQPKLYVGRFLELAEAAPEDRTAIDAWIWIITFGFDGPEFWHAIDRLAGHAGTTKVGRAALNVTHSVSPSAEKLLRAVVEKNDIRAVKGLACLDLGRYLKNQSERLRRIADDPDEAKRWEEIFLEEGSTREGFARFIARDPDALMKEAEAVLERTAREFGDVPHNRRDTLGDEARAELNEIRNLCVGKPAPEITGADVDGKPFALSDFRGKVVVLSFWADWCGSGRNMYTHERSLVERMRGRPFVFLGVNGDGDRDALVEEIKKKGINWRSWWDGRGSDDTVGPIADRFNVQIWSTIYVLDQRGLIRHKYLGSPNAKRLDAVIDALVEAAEAEAKAPKK